MPSSTLRQEHMIDRGVQLIGSLAEQRGALPLIGTTEFEELQKGGKLPVRQVIGGIEDMTEVQGEYDA